MVCGIWHCILVCGILRDMYCVPLAWEVVCGIKHGMWCVAFCVACGAWYFVWHVVCGILHGMCVWY